MRIGIEITGVSVSKKGTVWIQAKQIHPQTTAPLDSLMPKPGEQYMCEYSGETKQESKNDTKTT